MTSDHGADQTGSGFDAVLRTHRSQVGLTQEELAARAGIGVRTVRDLERGHASRPQRSTADLLINALGLVGRDRADFLAAARGQPVAAPRRRRTRLPPAGHLIGRDADVDELVAALGSPLPTGPRGVTLVGLAGVGKTSLALAVAHRGAAHHPGGVSGIVITDVSTAGDVLIAVAAAFGVARPDDLPHQLADASALLVVDAVERAPDAVAQALTLLLRQVPTLRFLATGRHPVGLPCERVWPLAPLEVPPVGFPPGSAREADAAPTLADVAEYPAVALFLERLARVRRAPVAPGEVAPLVALVRRLGGLPLALELAAARGRVLTIAEILDRYGDRVLDLAGPAEAGVPGADETAVSLRDAVAASYRLLAPAERHAVQRLSTFQSRWSLELAELMLDDGPAAGTDPVQLLDRLLELGLLSARGTSTFRFRLLDVVRDFATERAAAEGELAGARHRHARVMADLAQRIAPDLIGGNLADAACRLDEVADDLGAALAFGAGEDPRTALRIAAALPRWWRLRGRDVAGRQWLCRLLDDPRTADTDPAVRAWAQVGLAQLALEQAEGAHVVGSVVGALAQFERLGSVSGQLTAHTLLSALWMTAGRYDIAREHGQAACELARSSGRIRDTAVAELNVTWHDIREGDLPAARRRLASVDRLARRCGEHRLRAVALAYQAEVARLDGRLDDARALGRRAGEALLAVGEAGHRRRALVTVGLALAEAGQLDDADEILAELRVGAEQSVSAAAGVIAGDGPVAVVAGAIALRRGELDRAADFFAIAAERYDRGHGVRDAVEALAGLIASRADAGHRQSAVRRLAELCRTGGITLLPRDRALLGADVVGQLTSSAG